MNIIKKIITFLLLGILLTSNSIGIHFYTADHTDKCNISHCKNEDSNSTDDETCNICLLAFNLSQLNFQSPLPISIEYTSNNIFLTKHKIFDSSNLSYKNYVFIANRNKAPPFLA